MAQVRVHYHAFLREKLGLNSELLAVSCDAPNAGAIIDAFVFAHPEFAQLAAALNIAINEEVVARGAALPTGADARIDLLPPYGGG